MNLTQKEKNTLLLLVFLSVTLCIVLFSLEPIAQDNSYHNFADKNEYFSIPNFFDVLSNLAFIVVGFSGLYHLFGKNCRVFQIDRLPYCLFFISVTLVGFGSAYYHLWPDNTTLVWDRLPMTLAFMALFTFVISEFISKTLALKLFYPLLILGLCSVLYWTWSESNGVGDLRPYILVQFLPMLMIPIILLRFKSAYTNSEGYWYLLTAYIVAKVFEYFDKEVFDLLGFISGHSLKHLVAAFGIYLLLRSFKSRRLL